MSDEPAPVLVTGATGQQGGATARALLAAGTPVRAIVRDPAGERARAIAELGAELVPGDLRDPEAARRAVKGVRAVFSVPMANPANVDGDDERVIGTQLIDAAKEAGVKQFVHTSVSGAGQHVDAPGWAEGRWKIMEHYLASKVALQDHVREAGFARWTIIKPAFFMSNLAYLMANGLQGGIVTPIQPETPIALVATQDIGAAAAAAFADPVRFHEVELELASDRMPWRRVGEILSEVVGVAVPVPALTTDEAIAAGMPEMGRRYEWTNAVPHPARPRFAREFGIPLTSFRDWARVHFGR